MAAICPVCEAPDARPFLRRAEVPVHQNMVLRDRTAARRLTRGELALAACGRCGFVFNTAFDEAKLGYGEAYDNTQTCSPFFQAYTDELARHLVEARGVRGARVVEVGCGKGQFLRQVVGWPGAANTGLGFDPSYVGPLVDLDGRLRFERSFYGPAWAHEPADVVICRHVIEHVPDPVGLLASVRQALAASPRARVFFETPCVEWILREQATWDFFYEHCSLFTAASLTTAFERSGFAVESVRHLFEGQYLWLEARPAEAPVEVRRAPGPIAELAERFGRLERAQLEAMGRVVRALAAEGGVALWGAGAKGATLANLLDPHGEWLAGLVDVNPNKQGGFLPGTGHPIVAPEALPGMGVRHALLMNPNYRAESQALLDSQGLDITLIDWMARVRSLAG